jgi:hypothetical protein
MTMTLSGMEKLERSMGRTLRSVEARLVNIRKKIAADLMDSLLENIPVWSGKTIRSVQVSNSGASNSGESHPDRGNKTKDGRWDSHKADFGDTLQMPLGSEPNRNSAEAFAIASVDGADYKLDKKVYIISSSYIWAEIDDASYRPDARNNPVVSALAIAKVKAKYGGRVR